MAYLELHVLILTDQPLLHLCTLSVSEGKNILESEVHQHFCDKTATGQCFAIVIYIRGLHGMTWKKESSKQEKGLCMH